MWLSIRRYSVLFPAWCGAAWLFAKSVCVCVCVCVYTFGLTRVTCTDTFYSPVSAAGQQSHFLVFAFLDSCGAENQNIWVINAKNRPQLDCFMWSETSGVCFCLCVSCFSDAIQTLQAEVTRLKGRIEKCLKNNPPVSSVRAAPPAQENRTHPITSTPRIRLVCVFQV